MLLRTYADRRDGHVPPDRRRRRSIRPPATGRQGAYNADDVSRAAVVYLRHWQQTGAARAGTRPTSCSAARRTCRRPPARTPATWCSGCSPTARSTRAPTRRAARPLRLRPVVLAGPHDLGTRRGLRRLRGRRPGVRRVPAHGSTWPSRRSTARCSTSTAPGRSSTASAPPPGSSSTAPTRPPRRCSAWPRTSTRVVATTGRATRSQLAEGIAALSAGDSASVAVSVRSGRGRYPARSGTPGARRCQRLWPGRGGARRSRLLRAGVTDSVIHAVAAQLGPDNGGCLTHRPDADRLRRGLAPAVTLVAVASADRPGLAPVAGVTAAWYFGANAAARRHTTRRPGARSTGSAATAPSTGTPERSRPSTACSRCWRWTPTDLAAAAQATPDVHQRDGIQVVEAESATLDGPATVVRPESAWTGESQWSGGAYVSSNDGGSISLDLPAHEQDRWVEPVVELEPTPPRDGRPGPPKTSGSGGSTTATSANRASARHQITSGGRV